MNTSREKLRVYTISMSSMFQYYQKILVHMLLRYSLRAEETKAVVVASIIMMLVFGIQHYGQQAKDIVR